MSFLALEINLGLDYLFVVVLRWRHESLALTTSISASINFMLLFFARRKFAGDLGSGELLVLLAKLVVAGAMMSVVCMVANQYLFADLTETKPLPKIIYLGLTIGMASGVYFAAAKLLQVAEAEDAVGMVLRKLRR